jgi:Na+-translocating ferredoxin:NAD+ oxidoreductase RnfD subunit
MAGHQTQNLVAVVAAALFAVTMAFFAVAIRQALRSGEPGESTYSSAAFAGGVMVAMMSTLNAWLLFALVDAADNKDRAAAHVFGALGLDSWLPFMVGAAVLLLSTGLGGLRTAVLPKWLSIATVVLGVCCLGGPTGFIVWFAMPVWCITLGIVLVRRQIAAAPAAPVTQSVSA